jgi:hypothetical protein
MVCPLLSGLDSERAVDQRLVARWCALFRHLVQPSGLLEYTRIRTNMQPLKYVLVYKSRNQPVSRPNRGHRSIRGKDEILPNPSQLCLTIPQRVQTQQQKY